MSGIPMSDMDVREIEAFLFHEARLLDERRFEDWLALFTETAWYWVPSQPGQDNPVDTVSLIYDDRRLLEMRVHRLVHTAPHAQSPPSRTSRLIGNVTVESGDEGGSIVSASNFQMVEYRRDAQRLFAGACHHRLERRDDGLKIQSKRVDLVNCDGMMDGLTVPF